MSTQLCITVRWLSDRFHGFIDGTEVVEWPPSPFRLFQALLAGAHRYGINEAFDTALSWLEDRPDAPEIFAASQPSRGAIFDHYIPDNDNSLDHRRSGTRQICPILLESNRVVHYIWHLNTGESPPLEALDELASTLSAFGWAIDQAYAVATVASIQQIESSLVDLNALSRFSPRGETTSTLGSLRVPRSGSIGDLRRIHIQNSLNLADQEVRRRKKWPKTFGRVRYASTERPIGRPNFVFKLLDENRDTARYAHAKLIHIAGMVRHLAIERMREDPPPFIKENERAKWLETFICGHRGDAEQHRQISYVPLPSIGHQDADAMIRNVMLIAPHEYERDLEYVAERLDGEELKSENQINSTDLEKSRYDSAPKYIDRFIPPKEKFIDTRYLGTSRIWQTVTPAILPGYDDHKPDKTIKLIQRALVQSGIEQSCEFEWNALPNYKNCLSAHKYDRNKLRIGYYRPDHLKDYTAVHLRLRFEQPYAGPLLLGAGRHYGFGLFAAESES